MPRRQKFTEVVVIVVSDTKVVVPGGRMNLAPLRWPIQCELPQCVRVGGHVNQNILGGDLSSLVVGDGEGDVCGAMVELEEVRDGRRIVACLYPDQVCFPRMVESDRALFCISHTSLTSFLSSSALTTQTHPLPLRLRRYFCGIWVVFFVAVVMVNDIPGDRADTFLVGLLHLLKDVAGNVLTFRRRDKDWVTFMFMTVFCGTAVGAKHVRYVTDGCDTDRG